METNIIVRDQARENVVELSIIQSIHEIRGVRVILDFDLAKRYGVENKYLKRAVRSNIERFEGDDFMFEITREELSRCSFCTLNKSRGSNIKYLPFAFTQLGVAMLSSVLNSEKAIKVNRDIMRAFVAVQQYALNYAELKRELDAYMEKTDGKIDDIYKVLEVLVSHKKELEKPRNPIGFRQNRENLINT
jgi:hypothetical protein